MKYRYKLEDITLPGIFLSEIHSFFFAFETWLLAVQPVPGSQVAQPD
jgi:hypothetical protein